MHLSQNRLRHTERQAVATIKHFSEFSLSSKNRLRFFCLVEWITVKTKWKMPNILIKDDFLSLLVATPGLIFISTEKCKLYFFKSSFISSTVIFTYLVKEMNYHEKLTLKPILSHQLTPCVACLSPHLKQLERERYTSTPKPQDPEMIWSLNEHQRCSLTNVLVTSEIWSYDRCMFYRTEINL